LRVLVCECGVYALQLRECGQTRHGLLQQLGGRVAQQLRDTLLERHCGWGGECVKDSSNRHTVPATSRFR